MPDLLLAASSFDYTSPLGLVLALLVAFGGGGGLLALLTLPQTRKRTGADASNLEAQGVATLSSAALAQMMAAIEQATDLRARVKELEDNREDKRILDIEHEKWDREAYEALLKLGVEISPPPRLVPHSREARTTERDEGH